MRKNSDFFAVLLLALIFAGSRSMVGFMPDRLEHNIDHAGHRVEMKLQRISDRHLEIQSKIEDRIQSRIVERVPCRIERKLKRLL